MWTKDERIFYLREDCSSLVGDLCNVATISVDGVGHLICICICIVFVFDGEGHLICEEWLIMWEKIVPVYAPQHCNEELPWIIMDGNMRGCSQVSFVEQTQTRPTLHWLKMQTRLRHRMQTRHRFELNAAPICYKVRILWRGAYVRLGRAVQIYTWVWPVDIVQELHSAHGSHYLLCQVCWE